VDFFGARWTRLFRNLRLRGISAIGVGGVFSKARMTASNSSLGTAMDLTKRPL
jgi:hypothetical protein